MIERPASRRGFMKAAGAAIAAPVLAPLHGAGRNVRVGFIGTGAPNLGTAAGVSGVEVAALCDSESPALARATAQFPGSWATSDYRQVLADASIDAVCISGPAASQAGIAVEACAAGKDVWLEPPAYLTLEDGARIVRAARKYERIVQAGTVLRSHPSIRRVRDVVRSGSLGEIVFCRACSPPVAGAGPLAAAFAFIDLVQFVAADSTPLSVSVQQSPTGVLANYRYPGFVASYETGASGPSQKSGIVFHGTRATLTASRGGYAIYPRGGGQIDHAGPDPALSRALHWRDFITCARTRGRPIGEIGSYILTAATCRLSALALRSGSTLDCDCEVLP